ncbi:helix-turn-helix transcriptional regulator [Novosphingobium sp. SL115]|uniref:helix-turn-helix transcriptional regulator n=1 Tax=Novosphingobium sp. SL115 TaxID=2995150 RepID=UPI0022743986|nr:helix-turn-helix transcriptional regulator [Novosphingobium sp. SL115]MCY1672513.1 helix-turn-helix transcriptional regulator [Novosphingobium sp. SL115]
MMVETDLIANPLLELTAKQREVLDLLIQHKTSKEISRDLGISPHTVDQRIMLARGKLNVASRSEVAQAYRRLLEIYEQPVYELSHVGFPPLPGAERHREIVDASPAETGFEPPVQPAPGINGTEFVASLGGVDGGSYHHVLPEIFDGPNGTLMRLGYMAAITVFLILIVLGGLSMFAQLSTMLDR